MFKNMKVGAKIASGLGAITVLGIIVGIAGYVVIGNVTHQTNIAEQAYIIKQASLETRRQEKNYIIRKKDEYLKKWEEALNDIKTASAKGQTITNDTEIQGWFQDGLRELDRYAAFGHDLHKVVLEGNDLDDQVRDAARSIEAYLSKLKGSAPAITAFLDARMQEKNMFLYEHKALHEGDKSYTRKWQEDMGIVENWSGDDAGLKGLTAQYSNLLSRRVKKLGQFHDVDGKIGAGANAVIKNVDQILEKTEKAMHTAENTGKTMIVVILGICVLVAVVLAYFIIRGITKPVNRIIEGLSEGAEQVVSASSQVSSASQSLAEGAAEQAASLEETSSSLEEMSSMTKQNADNAGQANGLMADISKVIDQADLSMTELTGSMQGISEASEETSKIIKTIDEIAFQTNLLALNAAVEAARAGEAGAGFAVVAEEVRNLAMRSAEAAKNTAVLIEDTVKKVNDGSDVVSKTNEAFSKVTDGSKKISGLVGEIAAASNEQAQGINQVNIAVTEIDKVTQQNAANAEESASASEEMNAQAEQMKQIVGDLMALVGGNGNGTVASGQRPVVGNRLKTLMGKTIAAPAKKAQAQKAVPGIEEVRPDEVIPMDETEFKDF